MDVYLPYISGNLINTAQEKHSPQRYLPLWALLSLHFL